MGADYKGIDWRVIPASGLILMALLILAALALGLFDSCRGGSNVGDLFRFVFARVGVRPVIFGEQRAKSGSWWASILYAVTPNWQLFWMADALEQDNQIPLSYLGEALGYAAAYISAVLAFAGIDII